MPQKKTKTSLKASGRGPKLTSASGSRRHSVAAGGPAVVASKVKPVRPDGKGISMPSAEQKTNRGIRTLQTLQLWSLMHANPETIWTYRALSKRFFGVEAASAAEIKSIKRLVESLLELDEELIGFMEADGRVPKSRKKFKPTNREVHFRLQVDNPFSEKLREMQKSSGFTPEEIATMLLLDKVVTHNPQPKLKLITSPIVKKMRELVPKKIAQEAEAIAQAWNFASSGFRDKYADRVRDIQLLQAAQLERRQVVISYDTPEKPRRDHVVAPAGFWIDENYQSIYFFAAKEEPGKPWPWKDVIFYKLDRIARVRELKAACPSVKELLLHSAGFRREDLHRGVHVLFENSSSPYFDRGEPRIDVLLEISTSRWVQRLKERPIHPNQKFQREVNPEQAIVVIRNCQASDLLPQVIQLGGNFRVLEPDSFREQVKKVAQAIIAANR